LKNFAELLTVIFTAKSRDLFTVRLSVNLLLAKFGITGVFAEAIGLPIRGVIGALIDSGINKIDLTIDAIELGRQIPEFEQLATEAWKKATARVYTEEEKNAIRQQYLKIISGIGTVGNGGVRQ